MADEPTQKPNWAVPFLTRLCVFAWVCMILFETFDFFRPIRQLCLLFGFWSSVLAVLNALGFFFFRRQGIFLVFLLFSLVPTFHFVLVIRNIAVQKGMIDPAIYGGAVPVETNQPTVESELATAPENPAP